MSEDPRIAALRKDVQLLKRRKTISGTGGSGITALTGDVTAAGSGSVAATIANDAVTYAKMQNISAASRLLGRGSASGSGDTQEITLGSNLSMSGTALNAVGGGGGGVVSASGFYLDDGSQKFAPVFPVTPPINGDFAWINQGGASVDTTNGGVYLSGPANASTGWRIRKQAITAPYVITVGFIPDLLRSGVQRLAVLWRQSSDGKLITMELSFNGLPGTPTIEFDKWTNETSFSASYGSAGNYTPFGPLHWYRIEDNNSDRKAWISFDGVHWRLVHTVGRTDFITADEVGFAVDPNDASNFAAMTVISWVET